MKRLYKGAAGSPVAPFSLLAGIVFNIGRKNNLIVFVLAMSLPVITIFIFILLGGKINIC
ncbi:hypothetical protein ACVN3F_24510 [Escherichia coli]